MLWGQYHGVIDWLLTINYLVANSNKSYSLQCVNHSVLKHLIGDHICILCICYGMFYVFYRYVFRWTYSLKMIKLYTRWFITNSLTVFRKYIFVILQTNLKSYPLSSRREGVTRLNLSLLKSCGVVVTVTVTRGLTPVNLLL